jgi:hypothetical protein
MKVACFWRKETHGMIARKAALIPEGLFIGPEIVAMPGQEVCLSRVRSQSAVENVIQQCPAEWERLPTVIWIDVVLVM